MAARQPSAAPWRALHALLLLLLAAGCAAAAATPPVTARPSPPPPRDAWRVLDALWGRWRDDIGFCVGSSQAKVERLAALSFPWPLPVTPDGDGVCSNRTLVERHLCSPEEIALWYQFTLPTSDLEKVRAPLPLLLPLLSASAVGLHAQAARRSLSFHLFPPALPQIPDNQWCAAGSPSQRACFPGFFDAAGAAGVPPTEAQQPHACCPGFFCPPSLTCMLPCPTGAFCPR